MRALPVYHNPWARHGDCYVLDPAAWNKGERIVVEVLPARNPRIKRPPKTPESTVSPQETCRVITWKKGRAFDFWFEDVPVRPSEPIWARQARDLRANGWSVRRIMTKLKIKSMRSFYEILDG